MKNINHIILIDDNKIDCFINQKIISIFNKNSTIRVFNSCVEALDYFKALIKELETTPLFAPDLIFLDINMPIMNGFDFLHELAKIDIFKKNQ